jgi:hypothetical protein
VLATPPGSDGSIAVVLRPVELTVQNRTLPYGLGATLES